MRRVYDAVDSHDSRRLAGMITPGGVFRFGNMGPVTGRENIFQFLEGFFSSIKDIQHSNLEYWFADDHWFVTGNVKYWRLDDSTLEVPFAVLLRMDGELISEYLIFIDNHELYS